MDSNTLITYYAQLRVFGIFLGFQFKHTAAMMSKNSVYDTQDDGTSFRVPNNT